MNESVDLPSASTGESTTTATAPSTAPQVPRHPVIPDICRAAFYGDFAGQLGPAGAVTQIVISFTPGLGTLAAMRDFVADVLKPEPLGIVLNGCSMLPVLGGFTKTAEVMNRVQFANESFVVLHGVQERTAFQDGQEHAIPRNRIARWSVLAAIFAPLVAAVLAIVVAVEKWPLPVLWFVFALPLLAIIFGHWGKVHARYLQKVTPGLGIEPGRFTAGAGAALGWLGVFFLGLFAVAVVLLANAGLLTQF